MMTRDISFCADRVQCPAQSRCKRGNPPDGYHLWWCNFWEEYGDEATGNCREFMEVKG